MKENKYLKWGLTLFLTACAVLIFYDTFSKSGMGSALHLLWAKALSIMAPVLYGAAIAYLLTPVMNWVERLIHSLLDGSKRLRESRANRRGSRWVRAVSILLTEVFALFAVYLLLSVLIPQLLQSINMLIDNAESYYNKIYTWANGLITRDTDLGAWILDAVNQHYQEALTFLTNRILPWAQQHISALTGGIWSGIWSVVIFAKNFIVGVIISVYLLAMKEQSAARCCKLVYGVFREDRARWIIRATRQVDEIFSGFVRGKLLDSLIIGVLCFIGCSILDLPYTPLISVVVGVTNIIPFFGPFLGAIPSAFLILLVSPIKCLYFILFVLLLQQLDGNVIGPKILGNSTGISSFWVIVAILVGGGVGGVLGMFLGVPVFACLQALIKFLVDRHLKKQGMPLGAYEYVNRDREKPDDDETTQQE